MTDMVSDDVRTIPVREKAVENLDTPVEDYIPTLYYNHLSSYNVIQWDTFRREDIFIHDLVVECENIDL